ncbi:hypothetical protein AAC387_Pa03g1392 [Persea americana]
MARQCQMAVLPGEAESSQVHVVELDNEAELGDVGRALAQKSIEDLTKVNIDPVDPDRFFLIGSQLPESEKTELLDLLVENKAVFAWTPYEMPGINPTVMCHKLNVDPNHKPMLQKPCRTGVPQTEAVIEEVQKLLEAGAIKEVHYPQWLANTVVVKKKTGKWRVCVDFTDLNKACPKDSFPLPKINQLIDTTAGHDRMSFLDAYRGYHQSPLSSVLIKEDDGQQRPISYTSKTLLDAETRYLQLEKLALALVSASRKLSHYFQTFTIVVIREYPLKALLRKADFSERISKWAVELGQYDIQYQPRTSIKAQVLADFIVEFTPQSSAPTVLDTEMGGNKGTEAITKTEQEQSWKKFLNSSWKVFVDGSSISKRAGASIVLQSQKGPVIEQALTLDFKASNNEAEYEALIAGLNSAKILEARRIVVFSDSQLVTSQLSGDY